MTDTKLDIKERLEHFEKHQQKQDDKYGAEVLNHARLYIAQLEARISLLRQEREIAVGYLDTTLMREYEKDVKALRGK